MSYRALHGLAVLTLTALTACGGSGGGGGAPVAVVLGDATFNGDYFAVFKVGGRRTVTESLATTGILLADGAGAAVHSQLINEGGSVSGPTTSDYGFDVAADGTIELSVAATVFMRGGIASDGTCALLGTALPGSLPGILVLARRQGLHDVPSLSGAYHYVGMAFSFLGSSSIATTGSAAFDGAGAATMSVTLNGMGMIVGPFSGPATYSVIADGTSTLTIATSDLEGGVFAGGQAAIWGGSTTAGPGPEIGVAVKEATSAGLATLQGAYWLVLLERDPVSDDFRSLHGTAMADGAGNLTLLATSNTEGVLAAEPLQTTTYSVGAAGKLAVDAGGSLLVGGVTQDGSFAAIAGGITPGSNPTIAIFRRK
jgi:hypothetical protein